MANEQNLRPLKLSHEEATKYGKKGAEVRKQKKLEEINFAKTMTAIMQNNNTEKLNEILSQLGIKDPKKIDFLTKWMSYWQFKLMDKHSRARDVKDFIEFSRDSIGQKPVQKTELETTKPITLVFDSKYKKL